MNLEGGGLLGGVLEMVDVVVMTDQAVEVEAKNKSTTVFSSRASGAAGYSDIIEDIGVAYALVGVSSSSVIVVDDMAGVGGSNDNGRN